MKETSETFQKLLKLKLYPVGVKFCKKEDHLKSGTIPKEKLSFCQMVHLVSQSKWTLSCPSDQMGCTIAEVNFGFRPKDDTDIQLYLQKLTDKPEIAESIINVKPKFKLNEIKGLLIGPANSIDSDASSNICAYGAIISYLNDLPNLTIPCAGAKRNGLYQDSDLIFVASTKDAKIIADAMLEMEKKNYLNFPIIQGYLSPTKPVDYIIK